jgi:hypothetical protein
MPCIRLVRIVIGLIIAVSFADSYRSIRAQEVSRDVQTNAPAALLSQQEVEKLVAPIALYPDALLAQILTASTYPLEVAMAARWSDRNSKLTGSALEKAMETQPWDPSVKGLATVPQVLAMMNEKLDWTQQLGEAFLAQPDDIQTAVQALRVKAEATGNLKASKEQRIKKVAAPVRSGYVGPAEFIVIEPVEPNYVYVPVYDPVVVYGVGYWSPAYTPFFWYPPWWTVGPAFGFGPALYVGPALWYNYNWGYAGFAAIGVSAALYSQFNRRGPGQLGYWSFNPIHRRNVVFKNTNLQQQFSRGPLVKGSNVGGRINRGVEIKGAGSSNLPGSTGLKATGRQITGSGPKQLKASSGPKQLKASSGSKQLKSYGGPKQLTSSGLSRGSVTRSPSAMRNSGITRSQSFSRGTSVRSAPMGKGGRR